MSKITKSVSFFVPKPDKPNLPLFIYLPGMDGTGELLSTQIKTLTVAFSIRCLVIPPNDLDNWDNLAKGVIKLIEQEIKDQKGRPIYLCGESFGGCLALKVILAAPWLFKRLILVNPASCFNQRPWYSWIIQSARLTPQLLYNYSAVVLLPFLTIWDKVAATERLALLKAMRAVPSITVAWRLSLLRDFCIDYRALTRVTQPVLIIAGGADNLLPSVEEAKRLAKSFPHAQITILPNSGHACLLESDVQLYQILKQRNFIPVEATTR